MNTRLKPVTKETIHHIQFGFQPLIHCRDAMYTIQKAMKEIPNTKDGYNILFVDFTKIFDTLKQDWMTKSLEEHWIPQNTSKFIQKIYKAVTINMKIQKDGEQRRSEDIRVYNRVLQADILSPSSFIIGLGFLFQCPPNNDTRNNLQSHTLTILPSSGQI